MNRATYPVLAALLGGCTLAPDYDRPEAPVPEEWPTGPAYPEADAGLPQASALDWRGFYTDEKLRRVISIALANNRDLRLAALNVELARALYGIQRGELYPALYAAGNGGESRSSADLTAPGQPRTAKRFALDLGILSWELDFFGRLRSLRDEALEGYLASEQAARGARILLVSSVADAYMSLAADREALTLAQRTLEAQQDSLDLVRRQYELDIATEIDLCRAQSSVEAARVEVARFVRQVAQDENALRLLAGAPVQTEFLAADLQAIGPPRDFSAGLSSEVLLRRPDILAAEHRLKGANALIGAARAAFFPSISLTSAIGTASDALSNLFRSGTGAWNYGAQAALPIFDARVWAAHSASKVQREQAVAEYEKAIQTAFREVADALALRGTVERQLAAQQALVEALAETQRLALARFEKGIDSYLGVLDAQRSLFAAEQGLVALRLARLASQVRLYAVLGGGGEPEEARTASRQVGQPGG